MCCNRVYLLLLICMILLTSYVYTTDVATTTATANASVTIDDEDLFKPNCTCKGLTCTCCESLGVAAMKINKNLCIQFTLKIIPISVVVNLLVDDNQIASIVIDPKNPPTFCLPINIPNIDACLKLHDIKLLDLASVQICSTIYFDFNTNRMIEKILPCVKLSATSGVGLIN